jgi:hypothetical protein
VNASLAALLRDLARQLDGGAADWHDAIVLQNYGVLPVPRAPELPSLRGFNLMLLARDGSPRHFAKCRPLANEELARETAVLRQLASSRAGARHVPPVVMGVGTSIAAQLAVFQEGEPLQAYLRRVGAAGAETAVLEILDVASLLGRLIGDATPAPSLDLAREAAPHLAAAAAAGLDPGDVARLSAALGSAGPVPAMPQHGDLWPPNVVRTRQTWVLLDFEFFGQLQVPMVDAAQLVRSAGDVLWPYRGEGTWIGELGRDTDRARFSRRLLGAARLRAGLAEPAAVGCLAFALLEITGRFLLARRAEADWAPALHALRDFAACVARGAGASTILFGRAVS